MVFGEASTDAKNDLNLLAGLGDHLLTYVFTRSPDNDFAEHRDIVLRNRSPYLSHSNHLASIPSICT
jgi:hypothetical protein